jgi:glycosyltransferase involved in cell wall biosynthesis
LFASGDSKTRAKLIAVYANAQREMIGVAQIEVHHALACFERAGEFDVINDHSGPPAVAISGAVATPTLHTVHGPLDGETRPLYEQLRRVAPRTRLISVSMRQREPAPGLTWAANIPNGVDFSRYSLRENRGDYLLFLGRMIPEKGAHRAITVANETELPLLLAGKRREPAEQAYYHEFIKPHLRSGRIEYLGEVSHDAKLGLLQGARATLFPIEWEEPFGLVMVESMACGTPVIATARGAAPEVVDHAETGFIVRNFREMPYALDLAQELNRADVRRVAQERFSAERMVASYAAAFERSVVSPAVLSPQI